MRACSVYVIRAWFWQGSRAARRRASEYWKGTRQQTVRTSPSSPLGAAVSRTRRRHESWGPRPWAVLSQARGWVWEACSTIAVAVRRVCDKSLGGAGQATDHDGGLGRGRGRASRHSRKVGDRAGC